MTRLRYIELCDGITTRLRDNERDAPALILVHGLANSLEIWDKVYDKLSQNFRVIAFDLPGFGEASRPDAAYDGPFFGRQIAALIEKLEIERAAFAGYSLGASAILHFSSQNLGRIDRAILAAPGGFGRSVHPLMLFPALPLIGRWLGRPSPANNSTTLRLAINDPADITAELRARTDSHAGIPGSAMSFHRTLVSGVSPLGARGIAETEHLAREFDRPALVLWGKQDRVFPPRNANRAAELLPQAKLRLIDECGHYPQWEKPEIFTAAAEEFLK